MQELLRVSADLQTIERKTILLSASHAEPARPREGMLANADGADWDPGSGAGIYHFDGTNWTKL
jgi:hypothetical protein